MRRQVHSERKLCAQSLAQARPNKTENSTHAILVRCSLSLPAATHATFNAWRTSRSSRTSSPRLSPCASAVRRRFLGVVGVGRQDMLAKVQVDLGPPLLLNLVLDKAKLAPNSTDATRPDLNGVSPIVSAVLGPAPKMNVIISNISQEQLVAINLQAPVVADGVFTDRVINICIDDSTVPVRAKSAVPLPWGCEGSGGSVLLVPMITLCTGDLEECVRGATENGELLMSSSSVPRQRGLELYVINTATNG